MSLDEGIQCMREDGVAAAMLAVAVVEEEVIIIDVLFLVERQKECPCQKFRCFSRPGKWVAARLVQDEMYAHPPCAFSEVSMIHGLID